MKTEVYDDALRCMSPVHNSWDSQKYDLPTTEDFESLV